METYGMMGGPMQFVNVGNEYINLAMVELVIVLRTAQGGVVWADVHFGGGSHRRRRYENEVAQALVAVLEQAGTPPPQ